MPSIWPPVIEIKIKEIKLHVEQNPSDEVVNCDNRMKTQMKISITYLLGSFKGFKVFPNILQKKFSMHATFLI
jgi:hypothetical protein